MDFFQRQDKARRHTVLLTFLFILGMLTTAFLIHLVVYGIISVDPEAGLSTGDKWGLFFIDMIAVCGFILIVALFKTWSLNRSGPDGVALSLGGTLVSRGSYDPRERRLYNVVEEIAIAAGTPIPRVYILKQEKSINACAIGTSSGNSAVCVTRGAMDYLTRDELQGVVAHEFSHIVNNDVSINTKLIGYLFGLEVIAIIAAFIFRATLCAPVNDTHTRSSSDDDKDSSNSWVVILAILAISGLLFVIGYIGVFFGNIIRSAISRQREYLADASAVQFTRNPDGIAGALKKIGCSSLGSNIDNSKSVQASHLFFGSVFSSGLLDSLFQTHPDLTKRIQAIDPTFDGVYPEKVDPIDWSTFENNASTSSQANVPNPVSALKEALGVGAPLSGFASGAPSSYAQDSSVQVNASEVSSSQLGTPRDQLYGTQFAEASSESEKLSGSPKDSFGDINNLRVESSILVECPVELDNFLVDYYSAVAAFFVILLGEDQNERRVQIEILQNAYGDALRAELERAFDLVGRLGKSPRLIVARKALPLLKTSSLQEYRKFRDVVLKLCAADGVLDIFEYTLQALAIRELDLYYRLGKEPKVIYHTLSSVSDAFALSLSYLAHNGAVQPGDELKAFQDGVAQIDLNIELQPLEQCTLNGFSKSLNALAVSSPQIKKDFLFAVYRCVASDGVVTEDEAAIVSAVTAALGAPAPIWKDLSV